MIYGFAIGSTLVMLLMVFDTLLTHFQFQNQRVGQVLANVQHHNILPVFVAFLLNSCLLMFPTIISTWIAFFISILFWAFYSIILVSAYQLLILTENAQSTASNGTEEK